MILVTGAGGLLGSHVVQKLVARGERPRALVRALSKRSFLATLEEGQADVREGDLAGAGGMLDGVNAVVHCAALASARPEDAGLMHETNVNGTKRLYEAARAAGVKTWVQVSSVATLCDGADQQPRSEKNIGQARATPYAASKLEADQWLDARTDGMRRLVIHPCYMLDEWDARPSSGAVLIGLRLGRFTEYVNVTKNFVAARDVAGAILSGIDRARVGHFVVGGENVPLREFFRIAGEELGQDFPGLREVEELTDPVALEFCRAGPIDFGLARRELAYAPTLDTRGMIRAALDYFLRMKMLRLKKEGKP